MTIITTTDVNAISGFSPTCSLLKKTSVRPGVVATTMNIFLSVGTTDIHITARVMQDVLNKIKWLGSDFDF